MVIVNTWPAPSSAGPVRATVAVPGSKSQTNRALVLAALAAPQGASTVSGALRSRDTDLMIGALHSLGLAVEGADTELKISGAVAPARGVVIDCGLAGTVLRFVPPDEFEALKTIAFAKGFLMVSSSPLTRSSHHAGEDFARLKAAREARA